MSSAACWPINPCNWPTMAPRAASAPNTKPAMAMQMTRTGPMDSTV